MADPAEVLVKNRDYIRGLPPEQAAPLVGLFWERGIKPKLKGLSENDYMSAKNQFVQKFLGLPSEKLPENFGQPKVKPSLVGRATEAARAKLPVSGVVKGFEEGTANLVSLSKYPAAALSLGGSELGRITGGETYSNVANQMAAAIREHAATEVQPGTEEFAKKHPNIESAAEFAGKVLPSTPLMGAVGKLVPMGTVGPEAGLFKKIAAELPHQAAMGAAGSTTFSDKPSEVVANAAYGAVLGPLIARIPIIGRFLSSKAGVTKAAEAAAEAAPQGASESEHLLRQVFAESHPNVLQTGSLKDLRSRVSDSDWSDVVKEKDAWLQARNEADAELLKNQKEAAKQAERTVKANVVINKKADERVAKFTSVFGKPTPEEETKLRSGVEKDAKSVFADAKIREAANAKIELAKKFEVAKAKNEEAKVARKILGRPLTPGETERILKKGESGKDVAASPEKPAAQPKRPKSAAAPAEKAPGVVTASTAPEAPNVQTPKPVETPSPSTGLTSSQEDKIGVVLPHVEKAVVSTNAVADAVNKLSEDVPALGEKLSMRLSEAEKAKADWHVIASNRAKADARSLIEQIKDGKESDSVKAKKVSLVINEYDRIDKSIQEGNKEGPVAKGRPNKSAPPKMESAATRSREAMTKLRGRAKVENAPVSRGEVTGVGGSSRPVVDPVTDLKDSIQSFKSFFGREPNDSEELELELGRSPGEAVDPDIQEKFEESDDGQSWLLKRGQNAPPTSKLFRPKPE